MKVLIIATTIAIVALLIPARSYSQLAHNNVSIPAKRTYTTTMSSTPAPFAFDLNRTEPTPINYEQVCKEMVYPSEAVDAGIEGNVQVRVLVSEGGTYLRHQLVYSASPILSKAVAPYVRKLSFTPATENGIATTGWVSVPFFFNLK